MGRRQQSLGISLFCTTKLVQHRDLDSSPPRPSLGPRVVSVNNDGSAFLAGWALIQPYLNGVFKDILLAEFPYPTGSLNLGSTALDSSRNLIYAEIPSAGPSAPPVLHVLDSDNLTVRERIQLPENLAGRSIFSSDMNTLYAISDNGVTVLPIGSFSTAHRVSTQEEQLLFLSGGCNTGTIQQTLHVVDLGGGNTDFAFSLPAGIQGIKFSQVSGTTPATVTIQVDPSAFLSQTGTTVVPLSIQSAGSIGIPNPVRLLINTKDPDQRGIIHSLPGTIVDLAADPFRPRIYALRQDRNQVIVMDGTQLQHPGDTPHGKYADQDGVHPRQQIHDRRQRSLSDRERIRSRRATTYAVHRVSARPLSPLDRRSRFHDSCNQPQQPLAAIRRSPCRSAVRVVHV